MPELPEVETIKKSLKKKLLAQKVTSTEVRTSKLRWLLQENLASKINNQIILDVIRKGKVLCIKLSDGFLLVHLGMTGKVLIKSHNYTPLKHDHVIFRLRDISLVYNDPRRFGYIEWAKDIDKSHPRFYHKGPDPFDDEFTLQYLTSKLKKSKAEVKLCLMNDKVLTGIGNIYANELLFRARISPVKRSHLLSNTEILKIFENTRPLLEEAISLGGSTLRDYVDSNGEKGTFQDYHRVYNRHGKPCVICGAEIEKVVIAGRSTFFCPVCQGAGDGNK